MRTGTIIVNCHRDVSESEMDDFSRENRVEVNRVSNLLNRYAIEVPAGREEEWLTKLSKSNLFQYVNQHFLAGPRKKKVAKDEVTE